MSLPPTFLDELRGRLSLAQVVGRKVMWDQRKSNQGKGDFWAPCPFHQEKSASFHVDDRKGFYYCFGCHAKGDALTFVRETENVGFMEAVEILAREAGMPMPARDPAAAQKADRRTVLADLVEAAVAFYRLQLKTAAAGAARDYLARRGLDPAAQERWGIGFAPDDRQALFRHLTGKGARAEDVVASGVAALPEGGGAPYDRFRGRIIFPIRDARGRAISLGGRAMDPHARAKYLNGPETELFDKGRNLFNLGQAREAAGKGKALILAEGYMDVIALAEAGFAAVAPLGTAVTEDQLRLAWRVSDEPVVALDGDRAGIRAALRVVDLALPMVEAGKGLRFAILPDGLDPDDLIRREGAPAMAAVLDRAEPMVRLLWRRETEGKVLDSPERKAALDKSLRAAIGRIRDPGIRAHYGAEIAELRRELFRPRRQGAAAPRGRQGREAPVIGVPGAAKASMLARDETGQEALHETVLLAVGLRNPGALPAYVAEFEAMDIAADWLVPIRDAVLRALAEGGPVTLAESVMALVGPGPLERLMSDRHVSVCPAILRPGDLELAGQTLADGFAKLRARRGHAAALEEALEDFPSAEEEWLTRRLSAAAAGVDVTRPKEHEDARDVHVADNGLAVDKEERQLFDQLLQNISYAKGRGG